MCGPSRRCKLVLVSDYILLHKSYNYILLIYMLSIKYYYILFIYIHIITLLVEGNACQIILSMLERCREYLTTPS